MIALYKMVSVLSLIKQIIIMTALYKMVCLKSDYTDCRSFPFPSVGSSSHSAGVTEDKVQIILIHLPCAHHHHCRHHHHLRKMEKRCSTP